MWIRLLNKSKSNSYSKQIEVISRTIKDGRVVSLIHKYLNAGVMVRHTFEESKEGVPQGGPLSSILNNMLLNELDKELEQRGHPFVRYADDCLIMVIRSTEGEIECLGFVLIPQVEISSSKP